jgi:hypothetical protein
VAVSATRALLGMKVPEARMLKCWHNAYAPCHRRVPQHVWPQLLHCVLSLRFQWLQTPEPPPFNFGYYSTSTHRAHADSEVEACRVPRLRVGDMPSLIPPQFFNVQTTS